MNIPTASDASATVSKEVTDSVAALAQHLADIARVLLAPGSVEQTLERIVSVSVTALDGCDDAGLCRGGEHSGDPRFGSTLSVALDEAQDRLGEGPCIDALAGTDSVYVEDLLDSSRWPRFAPVASAAGIRSALSYRLSAGQDTLGALLLYARLPSAFNARDRAQGLLFAAHAGIALANAEAHALADDRAANMQVAMLSREVIGQAQGILMERERITADQAFDLLRRASQHLGRKLRDVAQELVETGSVPESAFDRRGASTSRDTPAP